jgi:outer membrane receptor protein involved in Fe transport
MRLECKVFRLAVLASVVLAGTAMAQTPPPAQSENPPGTANPQDQAAAAAAPQAAPAEATGAPATRNKAEEEIVVTGSRVRRKDLTTPAPVTVINREQIQASGISNIGDFLQQMPEQGGAINTNVNNGGDGETAISLRNLGAQRTLVLVDGKRWVYGGSTGSGLSNAVDLNSIPTNVIERVEVLKDGASAVYGSDAIGGVVNIITRRRVNGVEASAYYGMSQHSDAQQTDLSVIGGAAGDRGSFMFSAGYFDQKSMLAGNRDWASSALLYDYSAAPGDPNQVTHGGSGTIPMGRERVNLTDPTCAGNPICGLLNSTYGGNYTAAADGSKNVYFVNLGSTSTLPVCGATVAKANYLSCQVKDPRTGLGYRPYVSSGATNDLYNFQAVNYLITPSQRVSLFSNGDFNISDSARAYFQGSLVNRQSSVQLAPEPLITSQFGAAYSAGNPFNPFGQDLLDVRKRLVEYAPRSQAFNNTTYRAVVGVDGTLPSDFGPLQGMFWDLNFNYGRVDGSTQNYGSINTQATTNGLGPSCPANAINCVPVDLVGGAGSLTPDMVTALGGYRGVQSAFSQIAAAQANVSAELFQIASSRPVGLAAGYEWRQLYGGFTPDPVGQAGLSFDYNANPTSGSYHVNEGYAELDVPLISNMPFAEDLEAQAAVRVYNYSTFGSGATYKFGGRWKPIRDITLRGTYSTGFRAPDISDLYSGNAPSAESAVDPCASAAAGSPTGQRCAQFAAAQGSSAAKVTANGDTSVQINSTVGGNANLQPENANIGTAGVVFEPSFLRNFSITADWYNIKVTQNLGFITTPVILNGCYLSGVDSYCSKITRDPNTGFISNVSDIEQNVGSVQTSGFDFALRYALPTDYGRFGILFDSNYLVYYRQTLALGQVISAAGNYDLGSGSPVSNLTPKFKANIGINYSRSGFNVGWRGRYIGGFDECAGADGASDSSGLCSLPSPPVDANGNPVPGGTPYAPHHVSAYFAMDLFASYLLRSPIGSTTFSLGVRNLANADPPRVYNAFLTYTDPSYDFVGRFFYGRVTQAF